MLWDIAATPSGFLAGKCSLRYRRRGAAAIGRLPNSKASKGGPPHLVTKQVIFAVESHEMCDYKEGRTVMVPIGYHWR